MPLPELKVNYKLEKQTLSEQEEWELERLKWAVATAQNSPHLWQHKYKGTPLQILIEHARKSL